MSERSDPGRAGAAFIAVLTIVGLGLAAYLTYLHVRLHHDPTYVSVCAIGETVNCETVAASSHSVYFGLPVSVWGLMGYLLLGWTALGQLRRGRQSQGSGLLALYGVALALVSLLLAWISTFVIGALCLLCTGTYVVNLAVAVCAIARARRRGGLVACVRNDVVALLERPTPAARTGAVLLLMALAAEIFVPSYWELASWRQGTFGETGVTDEGHPWIGAAEPTLTIHEFIDYECPHCRLAHRKLRRILSGHPDELRLVRHDYGRMACKPNDAERRRASCTMARAAFCALDLGLFWEWNDAVLAQPRPLVGDARQTYVLDMAEALGFDVEKFDACLFSPKIIERAHAVYTEARQHRISETPTYVVDGKPHTWDEIQALLDERF